METSNYSDSFEKHFPNGGLFGEGHVDPNPNWYGPVAPEKITTLQDSGWGEEHKSLLQDYIELQDKYNVRTLACSIGLGLLTAALAVVSYLHFLG